MPRDFHSSPVQSWHISVQRELMTNMLIDVAYVGNRGDDLLLFANYNQAFPNNAAGTIPAGPSSESCVRRHHLRLQRRQVALQGLHAKWEWRLRSDMTLLNSLTLSEAKDNGAQSLENSNGNFPRRRTSGTWTRLRPVELSPAVQQHDQLRLGAAVRRGRRWLSASPWLDALVGGWEIAGINWLYAGEPVTFHTPLATFLVSGIAQDFRGANNYRPNVTCDPMATGADRTINNWFNRACVSVPTDPSQPFGNAERNSVRGPNFWDSTSSRRSGRPRRTAQFEFRLEAFNLLNHTNFRAPNGNRSAGAFGTITSTFDPRQLQLGFKLLW